MRTTYEPANFVIADLVFHSRLLTWQRTGDFCLQRFDYAMRSIERKPDSGKIQGKLP